MAAPKFEDAKALFDQGQFVESLEVLKALDKAHPNNEALLNAQFQCLLRLDKEYELYEVVYNIEKMFGKPAAKKLWDQLNEKRAAKTEASVNAANQPGPDAVEIHLANGEAYHVDYLKHEVKDASRAAKTFAKEARQRGDANMLGAFGAYLSGKKKPNRTTPEATVQGFFAALKNLSWRLAYNSLTDTAMELARRDFSDDNYLAKAMPNIEFHSLPSFETFWTAVPFEVAVPGAKALQVAYLDPVTARIRAELKLTWEITSNNGSGAPANRSEKVPWTFILIKRDGYWFMTDGYIWPIGNLFKDNKDAHPQKVAKAAQQTTKEPLEHLR